jgi:ribosomal protein S27E
MKKKRGGQSYYDGRIRFMSCQICGNYEIVGEEAVAVKCSRCVQMIVGFPEEPKGYKPTGRPAGWHFMAEYVDKDGKVFHRGKEQSKLKGTLKPTKVKPRKKAKRRTKEQMLVDRHNKKKAALKEAVQKQKDFLNHNINKGK